MRGGYVTAEVSDLTWADVSGLPPCDLAAVASCGRGYHKPGSLWGPEGYGTPLAGCFPASEQKPYVGVGQRIALANMFQG
ncbi:MAG: hypothetical protein WC757_01165 [Candidatus Paceibacterota bacterium]|jgi:hypothetical protein